jgi:hypothetical protein
MSIFSQTRIVISPHENKYILEYKNGVAVCGGLKNLNTTMTKVCFQNPMR